MRRARLRLLRAVVPAAVALATACDAGPFARENPYDPYSTTTFAIRALRDTAYAVGDPVVFQLVSDPPMRIPGVLWVADRPDLLVNLGGGFFSVLALPTAPVQVQVVARIGIRTDTAHVWVMSP